MSLIKDFKRNISNIPGWNTKRKFVVIESDDWGSVRTYDKEAFLKLRNYGLNVDSNHYNSFDSLESNEDLNILFSTLKEFKDFKGNSPVFTPMCIMGNPDFAKILENDFQNYYFQPLEETLKEYPNHDQVINLWKTGFNENIFFPELHGREHINVRRYLKILQSHSGKEGLRYSLELKSLGASKFNNEKYPNYLGALFPESIEEVKELHLQIKEAGNLFFRYLGHQPNCFIAPNAEEPKELESTLSGIGVKYLTRSKKRIYPIGNGKFKNEWNFIGKKNIHNQLIITRNCFFEPVCFGEHNHISSWVDSCLKEMEVAFFWHKPAIISSHRVNYIGNIEPENREMGIKSLRLLLKKMISKWPEIEFLSTKQLGEIIRQNEQ